MIILRMLKFFVNLKKKKKKNLSEDEINPCQNLIKSVFIKYLISDLDLECFETLLMHESIFYFLGNRFSVNDCKNMFPIRLSRSLFKK